MPDPVNTLEEHERFVHADISQLEPMQAWAELQLIGRRIALLTFRRDRGACLCVVDGALVYELDWLKARTLRLQRVTGRHAA